MDSQGRFRLRYQLSILKTLIRVRVMRVCQLIIIIQSDMPGSYRGLNALFEKNKKQVVKASEDPVSESVESVAVEDKDGADGKWDLQQNFKFAVFVNYHEVIFSSKRKRKLCKIFKTLSDYMGNRTPTQCRSHFQKMIAKHKSVPRLKKHFKNLFGNQTYTKQLNNFRTKWEQDHQPLNLLYPQLKEMKEIAIQTDQPQPQPSLCNSCATRIEGREPTFYPPMVPYNMNPMTFWINGAQQPGGSIENYQSWFSRSFQQERPFY